MPEEQENQNDEEQQLRQREQEYDATMREARSKITLSSKLEALKKYQALAFKLRKEIGDFSIVLFTLALLFAGFKDMLDIFSIELFSWIDWIIDGAFGLILCFALGKGSLKQIREIRLTAGITAGVEMIPIIGALPCWTASLFWLYIKRGQENGTASTKLEDLQKKIAKLENEIAQMQ